jgi:hypothetical protein
VQNKQQLLERLSRYQDCSKTRNSRSSSVRCFMVVALVQAPTHQGLLQSCRVQQLMKHRQVVPLPSPPAQPLHQPHTLQTSLHPARTPLPHFLPKISKLPWRECTHQRLL